MSRQIPSFSEQYEFDMLCFGFSTLKTSKNHIFFKNQKHQSMISVPKRPKPKQPTHLNDQTPPDNSPFNGPRLLAHSEARRRRSSSSCRRRLSSDGPAGRMERSRIVVDFHVLHVSSCTHFSTCFHVFLNF